jgi:uncharacterized protein YbjT (DUF2867 family)
MKPGPTSAGTHVFFPRPARLGKPRLLIVGCGDTGMHVLAQLAGRLRVFALTSHPERAGDLRRAGVVPLVGDLDQPRSLARLRGLAAWTMMLAPPPAHGPEDTRSARLAAVLRRPAVRLRAGMTRSPQPCSGQRHLQHALIVAKPAWTGARGPGAPRQWAFQQHLPARPAQRLVYASTSGVYGNVGGARIDETRPTRPQTDRARRRVSAETQWRALGPDRARMARGFQTDVAPWRSTILRIPGIYGPERLPLERLQKGLPRLHPAEDVYTNHIEIHDLARCVIAALWRGKPQRVVHAADGQELSMGDYFDAVADAAGMTRPPRQSADEVRAAVSPAMWSFMNESRRLMNGRLVKELRVKLAYPTVESALKDWYPGV